MPDKTSVYDDLGVSTVINGVGTRTQIGGTKIREEAMDAMQQASKEFVYLTELQARASERIAAVTGAEAGFVPPGAAAGLTLAAAACIAGDDYTVMDSLPHPEDAPDEILIPRAHHITYAISLQAAGAKLVDVGKASHHPVNGGVDSVEPWELEGAITDQTAAIAYVQKPHNRLSLESVVRVAHENDVPVIVDAASELPPKSNLQRFISTGADLVVFSGGKAIRGPQTTGILAGRKDLVQSAAVQQLSDGYDEDLWDPPANLIDATELPGAPRYGIGRSMKVGKEELVGLLVALEAFVGEDDTEVMTEWQRRSENIATELATGEAIETRVTNQDDPEAVSSVVVSLDIDRAEIDAKTLLRRLREETPRIWLGERRTDLGEVTIDPRSLSDNQASYVAERILSYTE